MNWPCDDLEEGLEPAEPDYAGPPVYRVTSIKGRYVCGACKEAYPIDTLLKLAEYKRVEFDLTHCQDCGEMF